MILKVNVSVSGKGLSRIKPEVLNNAFTKATMPKLYRYIEKATKAELKDKSNLPFYDGQIAFYDDQRNKTGKKGPHLVNQYQVRTEDNTLILSNKKTVEGGWNVFWMLTDGTKDHSVQPPKFMRFYDRYARQFKTKREVRGNYAFVPRFMQHLENCAQPGIDKGVEQWEQSGAMQTEFAKLLKKAGFKVEI